MSKTVKKVQLFPIIGGSVWLLLVSVMIALIVNSCNKAPEGRAHQPEKGQQTAENSPARNILKMP